LEAIEAIEMIATPKHKHRDVNNRGNREYWRREKALDEALKEHLSGVRSGFSRATGTARHRCCQFDRELNADPFRWVFADQCPRHVRFTPKADICSAQRHVRFGP
jgi:hypothetical protein